MRAAISVGCVRARGLPARQPARHPSARRRWLLNARTVAKTDVRIVFLSKNWVQLEKCRAVPSPQKIGSIFCHDQMDSTAVGSYPS